jgi:LacI family transcriptional regulator
LEKGCRNIAFISYKQDQFHTNERKRGFVEAVKAASLFKPENIKEVNYHSLEADIDKSISQLLQNKEKVDAIFFSTNSISVAGIKSLFKNNIIVQKDIQVMCFDESEGILLFPFHIPYIKQPIEEMAKKALKLLIEQIENKNRSNSTFLIDAQLIL